MAQFFFYSFHFFTWFVRVCFWIGTVSLLLIDQPTIGQISHLNVPFLRYLRFSGGFICRFGGIIKVQGFCEVCPSFYLLPGPLRSPLHMLVAKDVWRWAIERAYTSLLWLSLGSLFNSQLVHHSHQLDCNLGLADLCISPFCCLPSLLVSLTILPVTHFFYLLQIM